MELARSLTSFTCEPPMTTRLDKPLKREIEVDGRPYTVTISPDGVKVVEKGKRNGQELSWRDIVSGDTRLAQDLRISLDATME
jgi:hypothetical protein